MIIKRWVLPVFKMAGFTPEKKTKKNYVGSETTPYINY